MGWGQGGSTHISILVVLSCISSSGWEMASVTFLFVGSYRSAWNAKKLMWHSADSLHGDSFEVCEWGSCWFFLAGQRPATAAGSWVLKVGSSIPAPFTVGTQGGTSNAHVRKNYRFQRLSVPEIPLWGKQETRASGDPVVDLDVWKEMGQPCVSIETHWNQTNCHQYWFIFLFKPF